jgi:heme/copper-type cytochrome/quinol oxidase subunit 1
VLSTSSTVTDAKHGDHALAIGAVIGTIALFTVVGALLVAYLWETLNELLIGQVEMPRRTFMARATYYDPAWHLAGILTGIGGTLMFTGMILFFLVIALTIVAGRRGGQPADVPVSTTLTPPAGAGWETRLDNLPLWVAVAIGLILLAYGPFFATYVPNSVSPGYRPY